MTDDLQKLLNNIPEGKWGFAESAPGFEGEWLGCGVVIDGREVLWLEDEPEEDTAIALLIVRAPTLAAHLIAAEKVVTAARELADATQLAWDHDYPEGADPLSRTRQALAAYDSLTTPSAPAPQ
jgi:hypothetical protein